MLALLLLATAVGLLVVWFGVFRMRRRRLYELADKLPGLPQLPLIGDLHRFMGNTEDIFKSVQQVSHFAMNQGGICKIWICHTLYCADSPAKSTLNRNEGVGVCDLLTDPVDIEYVLRTCLEKDAITRFVRKVCGNGIFFAPASIWRRRRKIMAPGFSTKTLDLLFEVFRENSDTLVDKLQSKVGAGEFDLWPFFSRYSFDSVMESVCGVGKADRNSDYERAVTSIDRVLHLISERIFSPWFYSDWLYKTFSSSHKSFQESSTFFSSFTYNIIKRTRMEIKKKELEMSKAEEDQENLQPRKWTSFLRLLIEQSSKNQPYSDLELCEEVMTLLAAATDTTALSNGYTLLLLAKHQDVQEKLYQELVEVFGKSDRPIEKEDLSKLCYLEQVIKESLRLYPPGSIISRQALKEITLPSGAVLPAGCGIPISIWGVHRNPAYWGADAELFRPERFSPERYNPRHACVYIPFSAGPRNCIGYRYGMISLKTSLATFLRKYRVRVSGDSSDHIRTKFDIVMQPVDGFKILLDQREPWSAT